MLRGPLCTHSTRKVRTRMNDDDSCTVYITVFIEQDSFTLFKSANETVSNAKTEQDVFQMGQVEEDVNIKGCTMSFIVCSCSFYSEFLAKKIVIVCLHVSLHICGVD